jgi:hypothetical protein
VAGRRTFAALQAPGNAGPEISGRLDIQAQGRELIVKRFLHGIIHRDVSNPSAAANSARALCSCALQVPSATPRFWAASA